MFVVLDTCILHKQSNLRAPRVQLLLDILSHSGGTLVIPDVVVRELAHQLEDDVAKACAEVRDGMSTLNRRLRRVPTFRCPRLPDPAMERDRFLETFTKEVKDAKGLITSSDDVVGTRLLDRAVAGMKPFNGEGKKGLRDALIWEHVLDLARKNEVKVVFVTDNHKDYCEDKKLHPNLVQDLERLGIEAGRVEIVVGLDTYTEREALRHLKRLVKYERQLVQGKHPKLSLHDLVMEHSEFIEATLLDGSWIYSGHNYDRVRQMLTGHRVDILVWEASIEDVMFADDCVKAIELDAHDVLVEVSCEIHVGLVVKSNPDLMSKIEFYDLDRMDVVHVHVPMRLEFLIDPKTSEVNEFSCHW
ncbi:MAG: DUF4935 domain-containing protein [Deltaproteobacteria bacterium]|nr:DUF4935 domain-containing protein [Deltaproteobacteria bacterium]